MTAFQFSQLLGASIALPVIPAAAGAPFAWSLVLSGAVVVFSLVPLGAARSQADFTPSDLAAPRAMFERLPAWGKRANWAHQNSFEAFTLHAPACLLCLLVAPSVVAASPWLAVAAWLQPALRLGYIGAYLANVAPLRSLCWAGAILCTALLYSEGLRAVLRS
ncbi:MAPEG family protein [Synechococcus sp. CCY 9618]|uniref:MAPEG family protein n=1 Tax=Synechococcus sp. CCY 9618 TaxID=2815602 RepID=UPI001C25091A|nr:MAPEG family protein [Synechococcus sp. CCY 9618]